MRQALSDGKPLIVEGVHLDPGELLVELQVGDGCTAGVRQVYGKRACRVVGTDCGSDVVYMDPATRIFDQGAFLDAKDILWASACCLTLTLAQSQCEASCDLRSPRVAPR